MSEFPCLAEAEDPDNSQSTGAWLWSSSILSIDKSNLNLDDNFDPDARSNVFILSEPKRHRSGSGSELVLCRVAPAPTKVRLSCRCSSYLICRDMAAGTATDRLQTLQDLSFSHESDEYNINPSVASVRVWLDTSTIKVLGKVQYVAAVYKKYKPVSCHCNAHKKYNLVSCNCNDQTAVYSNSIVHITKVNKLRSDWSKVEGDVFRKQSVLII